MQGSPQTMEWWRSAAILLAQHHYTPITATVPPGPMIAAEGDEQASVRPSPRPTIATISTPPICLPLIPAALYNINQTYLFWSVDQTKEAIWKCHFKLRIIGMCMVTHDI